MSYPGGNCRFEKLSDFLKVIAVISVISRTRGLPWWHIVVKNPPDNAGGLRAVGSVPGLGRSPGGGRGNPLQFSCLENPMDREAWWAAFHRVAESGTTE